MNTSTHEQKPFRRLLIILFGIALLLAVSFITLLGIIVFGVPDMNSFIVSDGGIYAYCIIFLMSAAVSWSYFSFTKIFRRKTLVVSHATTTFLFTVILFIQMLIVRESQKSILLAYQDFISATSQGDYQTAYELMTPEYRQNHSVNDFKDYVTSLYEIDVIPDVDSIYAAECYFLCNHGQIVTTPNLDPSYWQRPVTGWLLELEKINGKWYFTGEDAFLLIDL